MWQALERDYNDKIPLDKKTSLYVGDAAGRPASGNRKADFTDTDKVFAMNLDIAFHTPEEFFLGESAEQRGGNEEMEELKANEGTDLPFED